MGPEFEKGDGRLRPSLQQRLPGAEGPPEGCSTAPRHAACGGPIPSSAEGAALFCRALSLFRPSYLFGAVMAAATDGESSLVRSRIYSVISEARASLTNPSRPFTPNVKERRSLCAARCATSAVSLWEECALT